METAGGVVLSGISYYWNLDENKNKLRSIIERVDSRKVDLLSRISSELRPGKKLKMEAQLWLVNVEKMKEEARDLENNVAEGMIERAGLGRSLCVKIKEAEDLYEKGSFSDGLLVEENSGKTRLSEKTRRKKKKTMMKNDGGKICINGMGGIGKTKIRTTSSNSFTFGNIQI